MKLNFAAASLVLTGICLLTSACRQRDVRVATVKVPEVVNEACEAQVRAALGHLHGLEHKTLVFDRDAGELRVDYDSMQLGMKNIEHAIMAAGFSANELSADPAARAALPAACLGGTAAPAPAAPPAATNAPPP